MTKQNLLGCLLSVACPLLLSACSASSQMPTGDESSGDSSATSDTSEQTTSGSDEGTGSDDESTTTATGSDDTSTSDDSTQETSDSQSTDETSTTSGEDSTDTSDSSSTAETSGSTDSTDTSDSTTSTTDEETLELEDEHKASVADLYGMAALSGCSGGVVNIGRSGSDKAVVLTNGHCTGGSLVANQAVVNKSASVSFQLFTETGSQVSATSSKLIYASLMETDIGIYELTETYDQLEAKGVKAFPLAQGSIAAGTRVRVTSSFWKLTMICDYERIVHKVIEGFGNDVSQPSIATNAFKLNSSCISKGGYSGTPVVNGRDEVVGLLFTGVSGSGNNCEEQSPCEEDENGDRMTIRNATYVARVDLLAPCIEDGELNLDAAGCTMYQ